MQTATCFGIEGGERRREQVAERFAVAAAYSAAHLVKVTKAEALRLIYYYCVHVWYVNSVLYNGCGNEDVVVVVDEVVQTLLEFCRLHLSMRNTYACIGYVLEYHVLELVHVRYSVVYEEYLSVAA